MLEMNLELCRIDKDNRVGEGLVDKEANPDSVSKQFDTLLKNASIFSRGCRPLRALRRVKVRTVRPGLTARVHSAPLPLLSQTNPLRWASFGFPARTLAA